MLADHLVTQVYHATAHFPSAERFALQAQLRRAAVSVASNIVEGSARRSTPEYLNFLNIAAGSAAESGYQVELAERLGFFSEADRQSLASNYTELAGQLQALIRALSTRP